MNFQHFSFLDTSKFQWNKILFFNICLKTMVFYNRYHIQDSPNQAKWATSSLWFQWNRPISVKKRSFSRPVSLFKFVFFSPKLSYFFFNIHIKGAHIFLKFYPYRVWCSIFYSKLVNCILFKIIVQHVRFVKGRGTCGSGQRNAKILIDFRRSPRFSLTSPLSQEREKSSRPVFTMCGEPWYQRILENII
jgi:hypothetical protein